MIINNIYIDAYRQAVSDMIDNSNLSDETNTSSSQDPDSSNRKMQILKRLVEQRKQMESTQQPQNETGDKISAEKKPQQQIVYDVSSKFPNAYASLGTYCNSNGFGLIPCMPTIGDKILNDKSLQKL
ncbi:hypothetical protein GJ496_001142 [Pomphorhynchus laevis]|nr:hypothetical protein GJ496_001142 [Pomphorhynchus laevis]